MVSETLTVLAGRDTRFGMVVIDGIGILTFRLGASYIYEA
jgi:hypothetical protein